MATAIFVGFIIHNEGVVANQFGFSFFIFFFCIIYDVTLLTKYLLS